MKTKDAIVDRLREHSGERPSIDLERPRAMFTQGGGIVGTDVCHDTIRFDDRGTLAVVLRAVDRAGNESLPASPELLTAEPDVLESCGCAAGAGGPGALAWLAGMLLWRGRLRKTSSSR